MLAAYRGLDHRGVAHVLDEAEAHIGKSRHAIGSAFFLHLNDDVLDRVFLVFVEMQRFKHQGIAFDKLGRGETQGHLHA